MDDMRFYDTDLGLDDDGPAHPNHRTPLSVCQVAVVAAAVALSLFLFVVGALAAMSAGRLWVALGGMALLGAAVCAIVGAGWYVAVVTHQHHPVPPPPPPQPREDP